jgi:peptide/nickel transport system substrate-binding protein
VGGATSNLTPDPNGAINQLTTASVTPNWDPHKSKNQFNDVGVLHWVYDYLLYTNVDGSLSPQLATSWNYDASGTTLTMQLRSDVNFQDGSHFDSSVAVANLQRAEQPDSIMTKQFVNVSSISAAGPDTLVIKFKQPDAKFLSWLGTTTGAMISPKAIADPSVLSKGSAGSGPFMVQSFNQNSYVLVRWPGYWNKSHVYPAKITSTFVGGITAEVGALRANTGNIAYFATQYSAISSLPTQTSGALKIVQYPGPEYAAYLNTKAAPFNNPSARMAFNLAVDRNAINAALDGQCPAESEVLKSGTLGHVAGLTYSQDTKKASQLLQQAGLSGTSISIGVPIAIEPQTTIATILQQQLSSAGFKVKLVPDPPADYRADFAAGKFNVLSTVILPLISDPGATTAFLTNPMTSLGGPDPQLATLIASAGSVPPQNTSARTSAYTKITQYLYSNPANVAPLCDGTNSFVVSKYIIGANSMAFGGQAGISDKSLLQEGTH